jgi:hypothetical protein
MFGLVLLGGLLDVVRSQEFAHFSDDFLEVRFEREVSCGKQLDCSAGNIALKGFCSCWNKVGIELAPHSEQRWLRGPKVLLKPGVQLHVVGIVKEEVELDIDVAGTCQ